MLGFIRTAIVVRTVAKVAQGAIETVLASKYPELHEQYINWYLDGNEAKIDLFIDRNATLMQKYSGGTEDDHIDDFLNGATPDSVPEEDA